jgi:hypothetical protein
VLTLVPRVLAAAIALTWFATLVGYWLDESNRQGVALADVGRFDLVAGIAFVIETHAGCTYGLSGSSCGRTGRWGGSDAFRDSAAFDRGRRLVWAWKDA